MLDITNVADLDAFEWSFHSMVVDLSISPTLR
jgi:hypothetical protein